MIGLNFRGCITDIARGKVDIEDVEVIFSNTYCKTMKDWNELIASYESYWLACYEGKNPDRFILECKDIAYQLIPKVKQPYLELLGKMPRREPLQYWQEAS